MAKNGLNSKNFTQQMCMYGFFAEQIPPCFNSSSFAKHAGELSKLVRKSHQTAPAQLSIYKSTTSRRIVSVPNPYAFLCTTKYMGEHYRQIRELAKSGNSESPITFIHRYGVNSDHVEEEVINSELARKMRRARSDFASNLRSRVAMAMGYRYRLSIDIATFYDSIYTHSIAWAICGKEEAKRMFPEEAKDLRTEDYKLASTLDKRVRDQKRQETNGILTGPFTSRIFSEVILASIDKDLRDKGYVFKRYVDDFKLYFRTEPDARRALMDISKVLSEYNLSINQSKTEIAEYPFDLDSNVRRCLDEALRNGGVYGALNEAGRLYSNGEKGVYKYALKMLRDAKIEDRDRETVLSILFNINLLDPQYARYIISFLVQYKESVGAERLTGIVNEELRRSLTEGFEQEVLNLLYFSRAMGLKSDGKALLDALELGNDLITVVCSDIWVNDTEHVSRKPIVARKLNEKIRSIEEGLRVQSMDEEHWLLLYEAKMHGLFEANIEIGKTASLFGKMADLGISFFKAERGE